MKHTLPLPRHPAPRATGRIHAAELHAADAAQPSKPNIVLIFIDDMGYGDIGPFGATKVKTPHLDKLAAEGMKFTSFYATPVCSMSRACLMTGCYNARVSIPGVLFPGSQIGLHPDEITLAEIVKPKGYATICIGKWHLGHREPFLPTKQGFDSYFGIPYSNDMTIDPQHARFAKDCVFREGMTEAKARAEAIRHTVPLMRGEEVVEYPADQATLTQRYTAGGGEVHPRATRPSRSSSICRTRWSTRRWPRPSDFRGKSGNGSVRRRDRGTRLVGRPDPADAEGTAARREDAGDLHVRQRSRRRLVGPVARQEGQHLRGRRARAVHHALAGPHPRRHHLPPDRRQHRPAADVRQTGRRRVAQGPRARRPRHHVADVPSRRRRRCATRILYFTGGGSLAAIRQGDWKLFLTEPAKARGKKAKAAKGGQKDEAADKLVVIQSRQRPDRIHGCGCRAPGHRCQAARRGPAAREGNPRSPPPRRRSAGQRRLVPGSKPFIVSVGFKMAKIEALATSERWRR